MTTDPPRYRHYLALKAAAEAALSDYGLDQVLVTSNPADIESAARHGVIVFPAPDLEFPTYAQIEVTHEAIAIAGPPDNLDHAWKTLDHILEALIQANLNLRSAAADSFKPNGTPPLAGYLITFNPTTAYKERTS